MTNARVHAIIKSRKKKERKTKMFQIRTTTNTGRVAYSNKFDSAWAANMVAIGYVRQYTEVVKAEIVNRQTGMVEKTYTK